MSLVKWMAHATPLAISSQLVNETNLLHGSVSCLGNCSVIELNGFEASCIICFNPTGLCSLHSLLVYPTRFVRPADPRGYLQASIDWGWLPAIPNVVRYDGTELVFNSHTGKEAFSFRVFVSPSEPLLWFISTYKKSQLGVRDIGLPTRTVHFESGPYRIWKTTAWTSACRHEMSYSCVEDASQESSISLAERKGLCKTWVDAVRLRCCQKMICTALQFAKIRTCESIFNAPNLGAVHSPGGGMFYSGVWCNDQAEYVGPLLGMLGGADSAVCGAGLNSLRAIARFFDHERDRVPYSVEVDGGYLGWLDRGDAAMFAWGASLFIMTVGEDGVLKELYPHVKFCCEVILAKMEGCVEGVVTSESDELEGRFPTGKANLSVNCTSILALESTSAVAISAGHEFAKFAEECRSGACRLRRNVEVYFGVEDERRYAYYSGCKVGRGWACLAGMARLRFGKDATRYVLEKMWSEEGVLTAEGEEDVWDRESLYAIRSGFGCGLVDLATARWIELTERRLTRGRAVPYMQENNDSCAQLSAESALYVRVVTEGLLGMQVRGWRMAALRPRCPSGWGGFEVGNVFFAGGWLSFEVLRIEGGLRIMVDGDGGLSKIDLIGDDMGLLTVNKDGTIQLMVTVNSAHFE